MKKAKVDVEGRTKELSAKVEVALKEDGKQESLKAGLKAQTQKAVDTTNDAYKYASDTADLVVGALGKQHELSKRIRQLREQMALEAARGKREKSV